MQSVVFKYIRSAIYIELMYFVGTMEVVDSRINSANDFNGNNRQYNDIRLWECKENK